MPVTVHDIARQLNLSSMTVSHALSPRGEKAAQEMGDRPNASARVLAIDPPQPDVFAQLAPCALLHGTPRVRLGSGTRRAVEHLLSVGSGRGADTGVAVTTDAVPLLP